MKKRILCFVLIFAMAIGLLPTFAIADAAAIGTYENTLDDLLIPYQYTTDRRCPVTIYNGDDLKKFKMMGIEYDTGFTFTASSWGADSEAIFALNNKYIAVSFIIGHIDNKGMDSNDILVYADGVLVDTIPLSQNMSTIKYTLNVSGVTQLKLVNSVHGYTYGYGFANGTAYTNDTYPEETIPTVSDIELYKTVAIDTDKTILPYQYSTDNRCPVALYSDDVTKTFSMMDQTFSEGIVFSANSWGAENECLFNLGGICEKIVFTAGHVSGYGNASNDFYFYADGELIKSELFTSSMVNQNIELDVRGVNQLRIQNVTQGYSYGYGFANIKVKHTHTEIVDKAVSPTCTQSGLTEGKHCGTCNKVLVEQRIKTPIAHQYGEYISDNNATTKKDGTKTRKCSVCGYKQTVTDIGSKLPEQKPTVEVKDTSKIFNDIPANKWFKQYVDYSYTYGIFTGTSANTFSPDNNITRAQFVQVLANLQGVDTSNRNVTTKFSDVPGGKWFTAAVKWASENKIVNGVGDGKFNPDANVTREQMCVMLTNYAKFKGIILKTVEAKENFADDAKTSKWAKDAVYICQQADIVNGKGAGIFDPQGTGTRAEASVIFTKFHKDYLVK